MHEIHDTTAQSSVTPGALQVMPKHDTKAQLSETQDSVSANCSLKPSQLSLSLAFGK